MSIQALTPPPEGRTITENGEQYFVVGKNRIKITEHFQPEGKPIEELVEDLINRKIKEKSVESA